MTLKRSPKPVIHLGLYEYHYVWIKNFNRLVGHQNNHKKKFFCYNCFQKYDDPKHTEYCNRSGVGKIEMPKQEKDRIVKFRSINKMFMLPFVIYSDFESVIINNVHVPCGYALQVISSVSGVKFPQVLYRGIFEEE